MNTRSIVGAWVVTLAVLVIVPLMLAPSQVGAMSQMLIAALFALAFSLLIGQGGMLSFGHAAYFAIGCFATVHAMDAVDKGSLVLPTPLMPIVGGVAALIVGIVAGYFATLRSGVYFSMVTLAIAELLHTIAPNLKELFGGETGVSSMRQPWGAIGFGQEIQVYYLVLVWVALAALAMFLFTRTAFGRLTVALRENERRVAFLGYNVHRTKIVVFALSAMFSGIAGGLLALTNESANYLLFDLSYSANVLLYSFIGGTAFFFGPAAGAAVMTVFGYAVSEMTHQWLLYQGLVFVAVMMYAPSGLAGFVVTHVRQIARGEGRDLRTRACMCAFSIVIAACLVFLCELAGAAFSRDYKAKIARDGIWDPVSIFGHGWAPDHALVWVVPVLAIVACGWALHRITRAVPARLALATLQEGGNS
ncbi:branched-chain amino acid ABC transporter permease [Pararobbsia silviterrae]|uniref:Branched-chain amino acid ABC transporter permease n=1 Tax=Pararobbsia silviterrae TaxID=1792498 RepID=A0A494Y8C5_9BURK|nr:branched-chain amino acid ABC transporter permease [Pararobbsia silviterrae]RKP56566.1 branched-chain amino acid ABC transporter permease [Pararobbsia silviterrae]